MLMIYFLLLALILGYIIFYGKHLLKGDILIIFSLILKVILDLKFLMKYYYLKFDYMCSLLNKLFLFYFYGMIIPSLI